MQKRIAILGSTGSIGTQALEVISNHPDLFEVEVLTAHNNVDLLIEQSIRFVPNVVVIGNEDHYEKVKECPGALSHQSLLRRRSHCPGGSIRFSGYGAHCHGRIQWIKTYH